MLRVEVGACALRNQAGGEGGGWLDTSVHFISAEEPRHRLPRPQRLAAGDAAGRSTVRRGWIAGLWWRERRRRGGRRKAGRRRPRRKQQPWQAQQRSAGVKAAITPRRGCLTAGVSRHGCPRPQRLFGPLAAEDAAGTSTARHGCLTGLWQRWQGEAEREVAAGVDAEAAVGASVRETDCCRGWNSYNSS